MAKITKMLVGESLVGDGNEVAHIDLIIGQEEPRQKLRSQMHLLITKMASLLFLRLLHLIL